MDCKICNHERCSESCGSPGQVWVFQVREAVPSGSASGPERKDEQYIQNEQDTHSQSQSEYDVDVNQMSNTNSTHSASLEKPDSRIRGEAGDERKRGNTSHNATAAKDLPPPQSGLIENSVEE